MGRHNRTKDNKDQWSSGQTLSISNNKSCRDPGFKGTEVNRKGLPVVPEV